MDEDNKSRREAQAARAKEIRDASAKRRNQDDETPDLQKALADAEAAIAVVKEQMAKEVAAKKPKRDTHGDKEPSVPNKKRDHEPSTTRTMGSQSVRPPPITADPLPFPQGGNGVNGGLRFVDCDGAEVASIEWQNGLITTPGTQTVQVGSCNSDPYA